MYNNFSTDNTRFDGFQWNVKCIRRIIFRSSYSVTIRFHRHFYYLRFRRSSFVKRSHLFGPLFSALYAIDTTVKLPIARVQCSLITPQSIRYRRLLLSRGRFKMPDGFFHLIYSYTTVRFIHFPKALVNLVLLLFFAFKFTVKTYSVLFSRGFCCHLRLSNLLFPISLRHRVFCRHRRRLLTAVAWTDSALGNRLDLLPHIFHYMVSVLIIYSFLVLKSGGGNANGNGTSLQFYFYFLRTPYYYTVLEYRGRWKFLNC